MTDGRPGTVQGSIGGRARRGADGPDAEARGRVITALVVLCMGSAGCWDGLPVEEIEWVRINKGTFQMGSPPTEPCRTGLEALHQVQLTYSFQIMTTEVTQHEFESVMGYNPSYEKDCGPNCPVTLVNWHEAAAFCNRLNQALGISGCFTCAGEGSPAVQCQPLNTSLFQTCDHIRLPTDAEWEMAYRAGSSTALYNGALSKDECNATSASTDRIAWYLQNAGDRTHEVKQKEPNANGLYDMAGNHREWVLDNFQADLTPSSATLAIDPLIWTGTDEFVVRNGAFDHGPGLMRAAARDMSKQTSRIRTTSFRCARRLPPGS